MKLSDFDYHLPEELIAQNPAPERDESRLMVINRETGNIDHRRFSDLPEYLEPGDGLVINRTRVLPARLLGHRRDSGGKVEAVLIREITDGTWESLLKPSRRLAPGAAIVFEDGLAEATVVDGPDPEKRYLRFPVGTHVNELLQAVGRLPLPPYIQRPVRESDGVRYQTVYADSPGAIAAPTAGLHFTGPMLDSIQESGIRVASVLLHVGPGTFQPVRVDHIENHRMEKEYFSIDRSAARHLTETRKSGRTLAVGTTSVRTLESAAAAGNLSSEGVWAACEGWTDLFIYPSYEFNAVDCLLTNFHLPKSTLLMLVSAFAGLSRTLAAYDEAVKMGYRFYSYGDAMLVL